jgi:phage-related minor tail protein
MEATMLAAVAMLTAIASALASNPVTVAMSGAVSASAGLLGAAAGTLGAAGYAAIAAAAATAAGTIGSAMATPLAEGGIVLKPTLALLGERGAEAVMPLNQYAGRMQQTIIVKLDSRVIGRAMTDRMISQLNVQGIPA